MKGQWTKARTETVEGDTKALATPPSGIGCAVGIRPAGQIKEGRMEEKYGTCCSCGYTEEEETSCPKREDQIHCVHWWDGPEGSGSEM